MCNSKRKSRGTLTVSKGEGGSATAIKGEGVQCPTLVTVAKILYLGGQSIDSLDIC